MIYPKNTYVIVKKFNYSKRLPEFKNKIRTFEKGKVIEIGGKVSTVDIDDIVLYSNKNASKIEDNNYIINESEILVKKEGT